MGIDGRLHLEGIKKHFLREDDDNYTYEGVSNVRDVDTESWISLIDHQMFNINQSYLNDGFIQVYYTHPNWSIYSSFNSQSNKSVPWELVIGGNFTYQLLNRTWMNNYFTFRYHILEYQTVEPDYDVFDVSTCFGIDQYSLLRLTLPLPDGTLLTSLDHTLLKSKVRLALSKAVNVPASRIGGIHVSCSKSIHTCTHIHAHARMHACACTHTCLYK